MNEIRSSPTRIGDKMTPREHIENIKSRQINSDKEFILDSLTGAIDRLQKAFPYVYVSEEVVS